MQEIVKYPEERKVNENIKISIITPVYNNSKFINETIISILKQTHKNFEILVIDDFSSDNSVELINTVADSRIKLVKNKENKGPAYCRNLGIKLSTGDYIAFLDGDDIWAEDKLEKQLNFMISNNYYFCCTKYGTIDEESNNLNKYVYAPKKMGFKTMVRCCYVGCLTVMFKRCVYPDLEIPENILKRNDYALWLKLSKKEKCYFLNETTAFYRKHNKNSVSSGSKFSLLKYHKDLFVKLFGYSSIKAQLYAIRNALYYFLKNIFFVRKK